MCLPSSQFYPAATLKTPQKLPETCTCAQYRADSRAICTTRAHPEAAAAIAALTKRTSSTMLHAARYADVLRRAISYTNRYAMLRNSSAAAH